MSDDLDKKIQQIAQLLGQDNVPDNLKELVALFASSLGAKKEGEANLNPSNAEPSEKPAGTDHDEHSSAVNPAADPQMPDTARKAIEKLSSGCTGEQQARTATSPVNDPRINLLQAIKPFMNNRRQKKIGSCIQLLQVASLSRLFNEHENR
ncbi:MAG: hypothetical protein ABFD25_17095 [Clostridiaceae bacterium]